MCFFLFSFTQLFLICQSIIFWKLVNYKMHFFAILESKILNNLSVFSLKDEHLE